MKLEIEQWTGGNYTKCLFCCQVEEVANKRLPKFTVIAFNAGRMVDQPDVVLALVFERSDRLKQGTLARVFTISSGLGDGPERIVDELEQLLSS